MTTSVYQQILQQLGGSKFLTMTGASKLIQGYERIDDSLPFLAFRLPKASKGINQVKIVLMPSDTYIMKFFKSRREDYTLVSQIDNVYAEQLQDIFTQQTGLLTHL